MFTAAPPSLSGQCSDSSFSSCGDRLFEVIRNEEKRVAREYSTLADNPAGLPVRQETAPNKRQRTEAPQQQGITTQQVQRSTTIHGDRGGPNSDRDVARRETVPNNRETTTSAQPKGPSRLPDRLKNRIYPGSKPPQTGSKPPAQSAGSGGANGNPFESATSKYVKDCVKEGRQVDPEVKRNLGGKKTYRAPMKNGAPPEEDQEEEGEMDERMKGVDKKLAKMIMNEIMDKGKPVLSPPTPNLVSVTLSPPVCGGPKVRVKMGQAPPIRSRRFVVRILYYPRTE
eukprot:sb/3467812/